MSLSWAGRDASKYAVKNTKLFHFIYGSNILQSLAFCFPVNHFWNLKTDLVRSSISYTNAEQTVVEETSKNWIYKAARRYQRAQAAAEKKTSLDDEEDPGEGMSSADMAASDGYYEKETAFEDGNQGYNNQIGSD